MLKIYRTKDQSYKEYIKALASRGQELDSGVARKVTRILSNVKSRGDEAVREYALKFDQSCPERFEVPKDELKSAFEAMDEKLRGALLRAKANIAAYHERQAGTGYELENPQGCILGRMIRPLYRVGLYVPGGTAAYPSTVLMNAIPAKIAGVSEVLMTTPPGPDGKARADLLAAAYLCGVDRVFLIGGAQAVAAFCYGTESVPKVDKIVGPGNIFVATAKRLCYGVVDIDMIAGPSEVLVIANGDQNPAFIAADLLSQAEHDKLSACVLLTTCEELGKAVAREVEIQAGVLERFPIIESSMINYGGIVVCASVDEMFELANEIAPEHLEILLPDPESYLGRVKNAGSVFLGEYSPEPLGDYYSGTNHVLPTCGTARFSSPLGVEAFQKKISFTRYTKEALQSAAKDISEIAKKEGLTAHQAAVERRFSDV